MLKAYKYRIYPKKDQEEFINLHFGACRFVYNWALEQKIKLMSKARNQYQGLTYRKY
jgi:putative transposase